MSKKEEPTKTLAEVMSQLPTTSTVVLSKDGVRQIAAQVGAMFKSKPDADYKD